MKARKVYESIDFRRSLDPKQSIGIGVLGRKGLSISGGYVYKGSQRLASIIDIVQALSNYYKWQRFDRNIFRFPANSAPPEFLVTARPGEKMDWPEQGYRKISYEEIVTELVLLAQNDQDFVYFIKPSVISYEWKAWQPLLENANFERGLDPHRSLRIGKYSKDVPEIVSVDIEIMPEPGNQDTYYNESISHDEVLDLLNYWEEYVKDSNYGFWVIDEGPYDVENDVPDYYLWKDLEGTTIKYAGELYDIPKTKYKVKS